MCDESKDLEMQFLYGTDNLRDRGVVSSILRGMTNFSIGEDGKATAENGIYFLKFYAIKDTDAYSRFFSEHLISGLLTEANLSEKYRRAMPAFLVTYGSLMIYSIRPPQLPLNERVVNFFSSHTSFGMKVMQNHKYSIRLWDYLHLRRSVREGIKEDILNIICQVLCTISNQKQLLPEINLHDIHANNVNVHFSGLKTGDRAYEPEPSSLDWAHRPHKIPIYDGDRIKKYIHLPKSPYALSVSICDFDIATYDGVPSVHLNNWYYGTWGITSKPCSNSTAHTFLNSIYMFYTNAMRPTDLYPDEHDIVRFLASTLGNNKGFGVNLDLRKPILFQADNQITPGVVQGVLSNLPNIINPLLKSMGTSGFMMPLGVMQILDHSKSRQETPEMRKKLYEILEFAFPDHHEQMRAIWEDPDAKYKNEIFDLFAYNGDDSLNLHALVVLNNRIFSGLETKLEDDKTVESLWCWDKNVNSKNWCSPSQYQRVGIK